MMHNKFLFLNLEFEPNIYFLMNIFNIISFNLLLLNIKILYWQLQNV